MGKFKAILFDLDGTLIDSERFYFDAWSPILKRQAGLEINFTDWIDHFAGHTMMHNLDTLKRTFQGDITAEFMRKALSYAYANADMRDVSLMPSAREVVLSFSEDGYRAALVTSSHLSTVEFVLGHHNMLDYIEFFDTRESLQYPKPNPEHYLLAIDKLKLPADQIVVIEDTHTGCAAAKGAGLYCMAVSQQTIERRKLGQADELLNDLEQAKKSLLSKQ